MLSSLKKPWLPRFTWNLSTGWSYSALGKVNIRTQCLVEIPLKYLTETNCFQTTKPNKKENGRNSTTMCDSHGPALVCWDCWIKSLFHLLKAWKSSCVNPVAMMGVDGFWIPFMVLDKCSIKGLYTARLWYIYTLYCTNALGLLINAEYQESDSFKASLEPLQI